MSASKKSGGKAVAPTNRIEEPAKVARIAAMVRRMLADDGGPVSWSRYTTPAAPHSTDEEGERKPSWSRYTTPAAPHSTDEEGNSTIAADDVASRLAAVFQSASDELASALSPDLAAEVARLVPPLLDEPSAAQARVALTQLLGWIEGLLMGIPGATANGAAPTAQAPPQPGAIGQAAPGKPLNGEATDDARSRPGQYL